MEQKTVDVRLGTLERDFAEIRADMRSLTSILTDIKSTLASSRPSLFSVLPLVLTMIAMLVGGVTSVMSLKSDIASLREVDSQREIRLNHMEQTLRIYDQRLWDMNTRVQQGKANGG